MKIAFLNIYQGAINRGAETFVLEVSSRLSKKHQVTVFAGKKKPKSRLPFVWRAFIDPHGIQGLLWTIKQLPEIWKEKFDIVIPLNGGWQPALVRLVTWLYGGKMVISGQSGKGWDDRNNLWNFPDRFVALSKTLQKWARGANPFVKSDYIPNGVDIKKFRPEGPRVRFDLERPIVLCAGALTKDKRIKLAIEAVSRLKKGSLLIVGEGEMEDNLRKLGRQLLKGRFLICRYDFENMPNVYRGVDLFTLPSPWYRSFEIVLVEAMATNLAVVANNDPIRREIVGRAGLLVDPTDIEVYASALKKALNINWGSKPRRQAEKFDWYEIARKYEELFEDLLR
ncbi:MAG: glycosyltransferase [Patescibacteria group bacterium]